MSVPLEHDYIIGLSEAPPPSMERTSEKKKLSPSSSTEEKTNNNTTSLNLKATELRLGLPGSHSPERKPPQAHVTNVSSGVLLFGPSKSFVSSGAKRGFSDAIDGKWVFSEVDLGKGGALFSPRSDNGNNQKAGVVVPQMKKEGGGGINVSQSAKTLQEKSKQVSAVNENASAPAAKAQVVGWPPIRSYRKNTMASKLSKNNEDAEGKSGYGYLYVKVSMEGAPYLRKVDLKTYSNYMELSSALETMFSCFTIGKCGSQELSGRDGLNETSLKDLLRDSEYVLTYEDKDGDWMLVGDVPWEMFTDSCRRLKIMKGSEAIGLAPRAMEKCKNHNEHYISLPDKKFLKEVFA